MHFRKIPTKINIP